MLIWSDAIGRHRRRAVARHRLYGSGLLRDGVCHGELEDAVRLQPGRGGAGPQRGTASTPAHGRPPTGSGSASCSPSSSPSPRFGAASPTVLSPPSPPSASTSPTPYRPFSAASRAPTSNKGAGASGDGARLSAGWASSGLPSSPSCSCSPRIQPHQPGHLQLRSDRRRRRARLRRWLLALVGSQVVHRSEGPRHCGRADEDRGRARSSRPQVGRQRVQRDPDRPHRRAAGGAGRSRRDRHLIVAITDMQGRCRASDSTPRTSSTNSPTARRGLQLPARRRRRHATPSTASH